jgi:hypothetical protein
MPDFTPTQGRYLAFVHAYTNLHGYPPAETEIAAAMCASAPSVNQMVKTLEKRGLISRQPGLPRTIQVLVPEEEIPQWNNRKQAKSSKRPGELSGRPAVSHATTPANLYVLSVSLMSGPISEKFADKVVSRVIEIRGDQTLEDLHHAIFAAYDRWEQHMYEFQFGDRPFDPNGLTYGIPDPSSGKKGRGDARTTRLDDQHLKPDRVFGYWFDFGDDWFHQIDVERIEQAIPTVIYPRVIKRVGKSPPQYPDEK